MTYCEDCIHVHEKKGPTFSWLCMRFPCPNSDGFVSKEKWDNDPPYRRCRDINKHGACPLFEPGGTEE